MENNKITVVVNEEIRDLMERTWLDYILKQDIIKGIINDHKFDEDDSILSSKVFKSYEKQCLESKIAYEAVCDELTKTCVPENLKDTNISWSLDFDSCVLTITVHEG